MTSRHLEYAQKYIASGFTLIRLYTANADGCSCADRATCQSPGKHPPSAWRSPSNQITTYEQAVHAFADDSWNIGIVTGPLSGVFVVDVDTKKQGFECFERLQRNHGRFPTTRVHTTGSGGRHYFFEYPSDIDITNQSRTLREAGYTGIDVRGDGGFVVAPPSTTDSGDYAFRDSTDVSVAPPWLVDLLTKTKAMAELATVERSELPDRASLPEPVQLLADNYASKALRDELVRLDRARDDDNSEWNNTTNEVAFSLFTLCNSPWNNLDFDTVVDGLSRHALVDEGSSFARFERTVNSAYNAVEASDLARPLPGSVAEALAQWEEQNNDDMSVWDGRFFAASELDDIPELDPLVDDLLYLNCTTRIFGASTHGKSFVALDLAACVTTGTAWHGRTVTSGRVLYVAAEGEQGLRKRVRLWEQHHGLEMSGIDFMPEAFQTTPQNPEWPKFVKWCQLQEYKLIILDTQNRVTLGIDENGNTDFGPVVKLWDDLYKSTGACVLIVHHTGNGEKDRARGASAVRAALQTEIFVEREKDSNLLTITPTKQKDDEESVVKLEWSIERLAGAFKRDGRPVYSVVLTTPFITL